DLLFYDERAIDEIECSEKALMDHGAGAAADSDGPALDRLEGDERSLDQVPQYLSRERAVVVLPNGGSVGGALRLFATEFGDRACDRGVQAPVQHPKVILIDGRGRFDGQLGDRLTDIAIIMHNL